MVKVGLYARYSSDNQNATSIEDQFRICRGRAAQDGWQIVGTYQDPAISGASVILRPGIQALLQDARRRKFDIVLAEALDRISRDQADIAILFKHLRFAGVQIVTLAEGEISELHVGLKGTMNALFLKDLAAKTHRGLQGRVEKGKSGGGLCYGYEVVKRTNGEGEPLRGERRINEAEALIVRRIFREFAAGRSPRAIATNLNDEGVSGPLGRTWGDTTLRGHPSRGTGILNNELYAGVLIWNRQRYIKDPSTGRRVSRPNPESEWVRTDVPELRIVDDALWRAVKARQAELAKQFEATTIGVREARAKRIHSLRRPAYLLSGLITCGCCGGKYGIISRDRYGCLNYYRRSFCTNSRTVARAEIERRALAGLQDRLVSADAVAAAVRAYVEQTNRQNQERRAQAQVDRRTLERIERAIAGIMAAIEDGLYQPSMKARMEDLERQKAEITARMAVMPADVPDVHPNIAELYRAQVLRLTEALNSPETHAEAAEDIRSLVGEVVIRPGEKRGAFIAVLRGELMGILDLVGEKEGPLGPEVITGAAACPRNQELSRQSNGLAAFLLPPVRPMSERRKHHGSSRQQQLPGTPWRLSIVHQLRSARLTPPTTHHHQGDIEQPLLKG